MLGLIGKKVGMTQIFEKNGVVVPVTVIKFEPNYVIGQKTKEKDGYEALITASVDLKRKRITKPLKGQFLENVEPKKHVIELKDVNGYNVGEPLNVAIFDNISYVDVTGVTKGKGFQGAIKRHHFSGGPGSHGSKFHRALGGTGQNTSPAKVFKGKKMPGRMGGERRTAQNLELVHVDSQNQLVLVKGSIPGPRGSVVIVKKAKKKIGG